MLLLLTFLCSCILVGESFRLDCENELRPCTTGGVETEQLERGTYWLRTAFDRSNGWRSDTHRAVIALSLADPFFFRSGHAEVDLMVKHLELELALALLRNETSPVSAGQVALYINALIAVCHDPYNFRGVINLVDEVKNRSRILSSYSFALISLALCNAGDPLSEVRLQRLFDILELREVLWRETQAMAVLALVCEQSRVDGLNDTLIYRITDDWQRKQRSDGSFGNVYTSALVLQAMIAAKVADRGWSYNNAIDYLLSHQQEDGSFENNILATYFVLPVLNNKTMVDLKDLYCS